MVLLSVGQHPGLRPIIKTLSPGPWGIVADFTKFSNVNHLFRSFDFCDFLEKHLHFFIRYLMGISKYSPNATRRYHTLFHFIVNHQIQRYKSRYAVK